MTSQITDTPESVSEDTDRTGAVVQYAVPVAKNAAVDVVDRAGNAILQLVDRAARTAESDIQSAREIAEKLADQLQTAQIRINELEANVRYYQGRAERAEKWMHQISSEIHRKFLGADDTDSARRMAERLQNLDKPRVMLRPSRREPATPSFLRRLAKR